MFINDEVAFNTFDLQEAFYHESYDLEAKMLRHRDWTLEAALDIIKMYCGM